MKCESKPSVGLLLALALAADDQGEADKIVRSFFRREISLRECIERLDALPRQATII